LIHSGPDTLSATTTPSFVADAMAPMIERFAAKIREDAEHDRLVLPSIPDTVIAVRKVLQDPESDTAEVCRTMSRDPALAARVLRVANSAAFGGLGACNSLQSAIVRLGNTLVDNVMLVLTISRIFSVGKRGRIQPHLGRLWRHSARVAALSAVLADGESHLKRDVALLAGLIHDIGSVPLIVKAQEFSTVLDNPVLLDHLLKSLHSELGKYVLESWNGPEEVTQVVLGHEHIDRDGRPGPADYVDVVLVANLLSHLDELDCEQAGPIWELPASRRLGIDANTASDLMARAAEHEAELKGSLGSA